MLRFCAAAALAVLLWAPNASARLRPVQVTPERVIAAHWRASQLGVESRQSGSRFASRRYEMATRWDASREDSAATVLLAASLNLEPAMEDTLVVPCDGTVPGKCGLTGSTGLVAMSHVRVAGNVAFAQVSIWYWTPAAERNRVRRPELPDIVVFYQLARDEVNGWQVTRASTAMK